MQIGKFNILLDAGHGSSGKGKVSAWLVDKYGVCNVSSSNFPNAGHCQITSTYIITELGLQKLGEVVKAKKADRTVGMHGDSEKVSDFIEDGVRKINKVRLKNGVELGCTDVHKYFVWDSRSGKPEWVRSVDLSPSFHQFLFPKGVWFPSGSLFDGTYKHVSKANKTEIRQPDSEVEFAEYLGMLVGNGYYAKGTRVDLAFNTAQLDVMERVQSLYSKLGITNVNVSRVGDKECFVLSISQVSGLLDLFKSAGLKLATKNEKRTPDGVLRSNKEVIAAYLRGLFDADGCAKKDRVCFSNCSEHVVRDAQQLLYILGIHSNLSHYDDKPGRTGSNRMRQWVLTVCGQNLVDFQKSVNFSSKVKQDRLQKCIQTRELGGNTVLVSPEMKKLVRKAAGCCCSVKGNTKNLFILENKDRLSGVEGLEGLLDVCENYHLVSIKQVVRESGEEEVFDLTVPGTHSYIANGCISHNSAVFGDFKFVAKVLPTALALKHAKGLGVNGWISPASGLTVSENLKWDRFIAEWLQAGKPDVRIHSRASIVTPDHAEQERNGSGSTKHIASTMQGCSASMVDKILRKKDCLLVGSKPLEEWADSEKIDLEEFTSHVEILDGMHFRNSVQSLLRHGNTWFHEGSQGYALSIEHGSHFPMCTSRNCTAQKAMDDMAVPVSMVGDVYLNLRTFGIRVGNVVENGQQTGYSGDFYPDSKELTWEQIAVDAGMPDGEAKALIERERTTVTKRIRRVCTFSDINLLDAVNSNGATKLILNFVQYLDWTDHKLHGGREAFRKLSFRTRSMIDRIEQTANVPVVLIGTGADHEDMISLL